MADIGISFLDSIEVSNGGIFPFHRQQHSRSGGGSALTKQLADPLWTAQYETTKMLLDDAMELEAELLSLDGSLGLIDLYDVRRPKPKNATAGSNLSSRTLGAIVTDLHTLNIAGSGFNSFSKGDYIGILNSSKRHLHKVTGVVSSSQFKVWPALSQSLTGGEALVLDKPFARFQIEPSSVNTPIVSIESSTKQATLSFSAIQVIE